MLPRLGSLVGRFRPAAEGHDDAARLVELDNHVGAFVDGPDVVVLVDAHAVGFGPRVQAPPDFAQELALGTELEQLRRRRAIGWTAGAVGAREYEDVALGINRYARDFAEIHPGRKLEEFRNGIEGNLRCALLDRRAEEPEARVSRTHRFSSGLPALDFRALYQLRCDISPSGEPFMTAINAMMSRSGT